jgi:hypothetical protein
MEPAVGIELEPEISYAKIGPLPCFFKHSLAELDPTYPNSADARSDTFTDS